MSGFVSEVEVPPEPDYSGMNAEERAVARQDWVQRGGWKLSTAFGGPGFGTNEPTESDGKGSGQNRRQRKFGSS
jgi:hypothetical protein